jgi:elongation factor 1 alpha-like protein
MPLLLTCWSILFAFRSCLDSFSCVSQVLFDSVRISRARVLVFNVTVPVIAGTHVMFHHQQSVQPGSIAKCVSLLDKATMNVTKQNPRCIPSQSLAIVDIRLDDMVCIELDTTCKELARFALRSGEHTIAAGVVVEIL